MINQRLSFFPSEGLGGQQALPAPGVFVAKGYVGNSLSPVKKSDNWEDTLQVYTEKYWCGQPREAWPSPCASQISKSQEPSSPEGPEGSAGGRVAGGNAMPAPKASGSVTEREQVAGGWGWGRASRALRS